MNEIQWWGYIHTNGQLQIKRYFGPRDITEALESPFVRTAFGPVEANSREEAQKKLMELCKCQR